MIDSDAGHAAPGMPAMRTVHERQVMDLSRIDLNLLVVLDALLDEKHVTRTATRLGLSQPAMSRSLGRLRTLLGDELLVRAGNALVLTPRAQELAEPVRALLHSIHGLLDAPRAFDAATARRTFVIGAREYAQIAFAPHITARVRTLAPGVTLVFRDVALKAGIEALQAGEMDLALTPRVELPADFYQAVVTRDPYVCVARRPALDLDTYASSPHVAVSPRGVKTTAVDDALEQVGRTRNVAAFTSTFIGAAQLAREGGLIATLPRRIAAALAASSEVHDAPVTLPPFVVVQVWHARVADDPASRWLREVVREVAASNELAS